MRLEGIHRRWDTVGRLALVVALCFAAEMLVYVVQMFVALAVGEDDFGSTGILATTWRWLAWVPALIYAAAVLISIPLPRIKRDTRWSANGHRRTPPIGRGLLVLFGFLILLSAGAHSGHFLPANSPPPASGYVAYPLFGAIGLLLLRIILGTLRLLPRSWRIAPAPEASSSTIDLPDQRFAPARTTDTDGPR